MKFKKITESPSLYDHLEKLDTATLLEYINREDQKVALAVSGVIPQITRLVDLLEERFYKGGRLFYIGAGTSGRLGILDASEIPPTYGMPHDRVIGLIAGGDGAIRKAVEFAEDNTEQAWKDLEAYDISTLDTVVGIAASGTTPYVLGGVRTARSKGLLTAGITNNPGSPLAEAVEIPIEINVGPEFITGSTRMKSGTSQKLALNMITTALMVRIGRVKGNKMVNMQLSNNKLVDRGTRYLMEGLQLNYDEAQAVLKQYGSVKKALDALKKD
ncbi:N-acetylmuramic acid 6-phosphate etherase [Lentiprolixibacter aurantiacus]|uniref:N-acetylmuramic acid 6-phosphate etherase n=1 Tax=Lentiprolixibacter aurantiacus TaxID=2993939 RepID=A0AAE3SP71_9FLAO|nr:N-acetylmuramic acid 6-phosphate etherase [Lentiprolixibacter aurantiacus]MCX2720389.1 N-acetylmuramic acid 6-phosphate etherase [Lentiprolixibacter aurantiacus]